MFLFAGLKLQKLILGTVSGYMTQYFMIGDTIIPNLTVINILH